MFPLLGQIGVVRHPHNFVEAGIEVVTRSPAHHVVVCVSETELVEAEPKGARRAPLHSHGPNVVWSHFPLTPEQAQGSADWALAHVGTPYNWLDDAAIGIGCLLNEKTPEFIVKRLSSDKHLQCAQLGDASLTKGGKFQVFKDGRLDGAVYPGSFIPIFKEYGWWPTS